MSVRIAALIFAFINRAILFKNVVVHVALIFLNNNNNNNNNHNNNNNNNNIFC